MNSQNQESLIASLKSIARSLEALLVRLDRIEERLADFTEGLAIDSAVNCQTKETKRCRTQNDAG
jgi:hypothetical protein